MTESRPLPHDTPFAAIGPQPCRRCGLKYLSKTSYIPCFSDGDDLKSWVARYAETLIAAEGHVPDLLIEMARECT